MIRRGSLEGLALAGAAVLLVISSFSYVAQETVGKDVLVLREHIVYRIAPLLLVTLISWLVITKETGKGVHLPGVIARIPFALWLWYGFVAAVSGFVSGVAPLWSLWKMVEIGVVVYWAAAIWVFMIRKRSWDALWYVFHAIYLASLALVIWTLYGYVPSVSPSAVISNLIAGTDRLSSDWPHINSINVAMLSVYSLVAGVVLFHERQTGLRALGWVLSGPIALALLLTRARTGLLVIGLFVVLTMVFRGWSPARRWLVGSGIVMVCIGAVVSPTIQEVLRLGDVDQLVGVSGRLRTQAGGVGFWLGAGQLIAERPMLGMGYVNVSRFMGSGGVDNGVLQALIAGGIVGALPMIIYIIVYPWLWFRTLLASGCLPSQARPLAVMGALSASVAIGKAMTTNSLSNHGFAFILFVVSVLALFAVRRIMSV